MPRSVPRTPPQDLQLQAWKLESTNGAPRLSLTNIPSTNMDGTPWSKPKHFSSPNMLTMRPESPPQPAEPSPLSSAAPLSTPSGNHLEPRQRVYSNAAANLTNVLANSSISAEDGASDNDNSSPWCGAVGRATLGKSGRVIERLMADIDKLKRELNAELSARQEIEKREGMNTRTVEGLKAENANLEQAKEIDATALKRRDRKIEELKAELDAERSRRLALEEDKKEAERARDEAVAAERKQVGEAKEVAKRASSHADVLESSHRQLAVEYRQRMETCTRDLSRLTHDRDEESRKVKRLDVVVEQLKQETERNRKLNAQMAETYDAYKEVAESRISEMEATARKRTEEEDTIKADARRIINEARWLINIGKNATKRSEYLPLEEVGEELDRLH